MITSSNDVINVSNSLSHSASLSLFHTHIRTALLPLPLSCFIFFLALSETSYILVYLTIVFLHYVSSKGQESCLS